MTPSCRYLSQAIQILSGAIMASSVVFAEARAHEAPSGWSYPFFCCSNRDCARIPAGRVKTGPDGYRVVLQPGDHEFVKDTTAFLIPYANAKDSPDNEYHLCITASMQVLCFFRPPMSY